MRRRVQLGPRVQLYLEPRDMYVGLYFGPRAVFFAVFGLVLRIGPAERADPAGEG